MFAFNTVEELFRNSVLFCGQGWPCCTAQGHMGLSGTEMPAHRGTATFSLYALRPCSCKFFLPSTWNMSHLFWQNPNVWCKQEADVLILTELSHAESKAGAGRKKRPQHWRPASRGDSGVGAMAVWVGHGGFLLGQGWGRREEIWTWLLTQPRAGKASGGRNGFLE